MHAYQLQNSQQTLVAALRKYHAVHPGLSPVRLMSTEGESFFRCHDTVHVVFGCSIDLDDEGVVKIASMLGTTAGISVLKGNVLHETLNIYKRLKVVDVLFAIARAVFIVPRTILRCFAQHRRWPWSEHQQYHDVSLQNIRQAFGITVAHAPHS